MKVTSPEQLGAILRGTRVALNIPLLDLAEALHTSHTLLRRQEHGKATKAMEILFAAMNELGIEMHLELPPKVDAEALSQEAQPRNKRARP